ncbi:kinase-like domain-containing protein [Hyaloraphidium curvatum]|nr:kinase-like domain-containing protein [Hyaloraphidium curvatum]
MVPDQGPDQHRPLSRDAVGSRRPAPLPGAPQGPMSTSGVRKPRRRPRSRDAGAVPLPSPPPSSPAAPSAVAAGHARRKQYRVLHGVLGAGSQGAVRLAVGPAGLCAIKTVGVAPGNADAAEAVRRMKAVWGIVPEHPGIVRLLDSFRTRSKFYFVNEFCEGGDLAKYLERHAGEIEEGESREIVRSLLVAVDWLHSHCIVHRDLKPANVLLRDASRPAGTLCLADFGSCFVEDPARTADGPGGSDSPMNTISSMRSLSDSLRAGSSTRMDAMRTIAGTPSYLAPEQIRGIPYGPGVDLWSLGCITYVLFFGVHPFSHAGSFQDLYGRIVRAEYPVPQESPAPDAALEFLASLLTADPAARPSAADALRDPWMLAPRTAPPPRPRDDGGGYEVLLNDLGELVLADLEVADDSGMLPA